MKYQWFAFWALSHFGFAVGVVRSEFEGAGFRSAAGIYEPSGVAQLDDGMIVVIEDEPARPFSLLSLDGEAAGLRAQPLRPKSLLSAAIYDFADLEGIASGENGFAYAVTSHSRKNNGKRATEREQLVRFKVENSRLTGMTVVAGLRTALIQQFPDLERAAKERKVKQEAGLNIEGLTFGPRRKTLWLGFRGPLVGDDAILVAIANPSRIFEQGEAIRFGQEPVLLDLDGGGIRGLAYAPHLAGYLILSQRESGKKEKAFKLWLWSGAPDEPARRVRIDGATDLRRAEAVEPIRLNGEEKILLLSDDGHFERRRPARYLLVDYSALRID